MTRLYRSVAGMVQAGDVDYAASAAGQSRGGGGVETFEWENEEKTR